PSRVSNGNEIAAAKIVQEVDDDAAVVEHRAIVRDQRRYLAQRILLHHRPIAIDRVRSGGNKLDALGKPELMSGHQALPNERGVGGMEEFHDTLSRCGRASEYTSVTRATRNAKCRLSCSQPGYSVTTSFALAPLIASIETE